MSKKDIQGQPSIEILKDEFNRIREGEQVELKLVKPEDDEVFVNTESGELLVFYIDKSGELLLNDNHKERITDKDGNKISRDYLIVSRLQSKPSYKLSMEEPSLAQVVYSISEDDGTRRTHLLEYDEESHRFEEVGEGIKGRFFPRFRADNRLVFYRGTSGLDSGFFVNPKTGQQIGNEINGLYRYNITTTSEGLIRAIDSSKNCFRDDSAIEDIVIGSTEHIPEVESVTLLKEK